jgi:predicted NACHT family NTPase
MSIKLEHSIREVTNRFELALSGFIDSDVGRELDISEAYFRHAIVKASRIYTKNYLESHAFVQIFGMQKPLALSSIYIPQRFQNHTSIRNFDSVHDLEEAFTRDLQRNNQNKGSNLLGLNIANEEEYLTILGEPATGKTTFLKYVGLEALRYPEGRYKHNKLPIFLHIWRFCSEADTLLLAVTEELEKCGFPFANDLAIWLLENGKLLILIDGLNESPLSQKYLSHHIQTFVKTYPHNRYIVSSRLNSYQNSLGQFLEVAMQSWSDLHMQEYIHKWFTIAYEQRANLTVNRAATGANASQALDPASDEAQRCWDILQINDIAKGLANSPLSLSLLCLLCDRRRSLPSNLSGLYQKAVHLLLEEKVLHHQQINNPEEKSISVEVLDLVITEIAYRSFEFQDMMLPLEEIKQQIQTVLMSCNSDLQKLDVEFILKLLQQVGICKVIKINNNNSFAFCHITFQEYFTARYLYQHNKVKLLVAYHLSDRRWQQVFLLLSGMMIGNIEELLLSMESQASRFIKSNRLRDILEWLEQMTSSSKSNLKNVSKRIAALFIARPRFLSDLASSLLLSRMLGLARDLYIDFDTGINFDKVFASDLSLSLASALDFDSQTELSLTIQLCNNLEQSMKAINFNAKDVSFKALQTRLEALNSNLPSFDQPFEVREQFRQAISSTWFQTLYLPKELNMISANEVEALEDYLYANLLMVHCKKMALSVSSKTWEEIESRILRIMD